MNHPFTELFPEYVRLLQTMVVVKKAEVDQIAKKLLSPLYLPRYQAVQNANGVPVVFTATADERESGANPRRALGQGDPWGEVSTHVPKGFGPFKSWSDAAIFYEHMHHLDDNSTIWSWPYLCWKLEAWNGFGPRNRGIHTGYLWAGTSHYEKGKYVADGVWDPEAVDAQIGAIPVAIRMAQLDSTGGITLPGMPTSIPGPGPAPMAAPIGVGGAVGEHDTVWLQKALASLGYQIGAIDGLYGRMTRTAVWAFQKDHGIPVDGLYGPQTDAALSHAISG